jgi:hypothetical protein
MILCSEHHDAWRHLTIMPPPPQRYYTKVVEIQSEGCYSLGLLGTNDMAMKVRGSRPGSGHTQQHRKVPHPS